MQASAIVAVGYSTNTAIVQLTLQSGEIGRLANGAVTATQGGTVRLLWTSHGQLCKAVVVICSSATVTSRVTLQVVYATACTGAEAAGDFLPLSVSYAERFSAAGRTRCLPAVCV